MTSKEHKCVKIGGKKDSIDVDNGPPTKKKLCNLGERCYRKTSAHLTEYSHPHLEELLADGNIGNDILLPAGYIPKISRATVRDQLYTLRTISNSGVAACSRTSDLENKYTAAAASLPAIRPAGSTQLPMSVTGCSSTSELQCGNTNALLTTILEQQDLPKAYDVRLPQDFSYQETTEQWCISMVNVLNAGAKDILANQDLEQERKEALIQQRACAMYPNAIWNRTKGQVAKKLEAAAPFYIFLTAITESKPTHTEPLTIAFPELLDSSLGNLTCSLQINFMVEMGWLTAQYLITGHRTKPLLLLYGEADYDLSQCPAHITHVKIKPPSPFGSHHTKMMLFTYSDNSVRVVVSTANLVESDWENRTQGLWVSPRCPALPVESNTTAGDSETEFKADLVRYLRAYKLPQLEEWIGIVNRADFSGINVCFVASTPGSHAGPVWGHPKLGHLLAENVKILPQGSLTASQWPVVVQCSSVGSLGPTPTPWLCGVIREVMARGQALRLQAPPPIKVIYPSFQNVAASHESLMGGGGLPYSKATHLKQEWFTNYLCQWKSDKRHRSRAMPHIKTYCRVSPDHTKAAWFHLTSANLSKAAWGAAPNRASSVYILSYEAGVLFLPKFVTGGDSFDLKPAGSSPVLSLPYDLPLTPYTHTDVPWFIDNIA